jgi:hypothetical protein
VLDLYNPDRSQTPLYPGEIRTWGDFLTDLRPQLTKQRDNKGASLRILTDTVTSPTLGDQLKKLLVDFPQAKWHQYEKLTREIRTHKQMLRQCLYPELEVAGDIGAYLAVDSRNQKEVDDLIASIEENQPPEQGWTHRLADLRGLWQTHVEQSENRLFPEAVRVLGPARLQQLEFDMDAVRTHQSDFDSAIYPASRLGPKA